MIAATGCTSPGPYSDPEGVQLSLFGDRKCSDPVFGQMAMQCCMDHDNCFAAGGTRADFHLCNHEFAACMLLWDVPPEIVRLRYEAVERYGWDSFTQRRDRTRGPGEGSRCPD